jgi:crotonobetainyl-CoA:carnitine CoA-transferase CaiB-like acyl-CoA transferase
MGGVLGSLMISRDDADAFLAAGRGIKGAPYFRLFQAGDGGWLYLAALTPAIFTRALDAIGRLDLLVREDVAGEFANLLLPGTRDEVNAELEAVFAARPADEWLRVLRAADVPAAPVWSREQWLDAGIGPAGRLSGYEHPAVGALAVPGPPLEFSVTPMLADGTFDDEPRACDRPSAAPAGGAGLSAAAPLPLSGLRVIDLSSFYAGPLGAALLADFGADVVKVEPSDGDPYRVYAGSYGMVNQRKRAVPLDLASPAARAAFLGLLAGADAVLDNFAPGSLDRLGLSDAAIADASPRLVRCTVSAFGGGNELSDTPGFDPVLQAMTGLAVAQGGAGRPIPSSAPVVDAATGALTALGILAALYARGDGGPGQHVRTCLASAAVFIQSAEMTSYAGRPPARAGDLDYLGHDAARRVYGTSTGWLAVAASSGEQRTALLAAVGHPEWSALGDEALSSSLQDAFAASPRELWLGRLAALGVPAVRALEHGTGIADRYLAANGFSHVLAVPGMGRFRVVRSLSRWEGGSSPREARFPVLGSETAALLLEAGVDQALVDDLLEKESN